jgi:hypothetical protein
VVRPVTGIAESQLSMYLPVCGGCKGAGFLATTSPSAPSPRIDTQLLTGPPLGVLSLHRGDRFPRSTQEPALCSRHLHAGHRSISRQASLELVPSQRPELGSVDVPMLSTRQQRFTPSFHGTNSLGSRRAMRPNQCIDAAWRDRRAVGAAALWLRREQMTQLGLGSVSSRSPNRGNSSPQISLRSRCDLPSHDSADVAPSPCHGRQNAFEQ